VAASAGVSAAFWVGALVCALTGLLTAVVVPPSRSTGFIPVDWVGAVLLSTGTAGLLLAATRGPAWGWSSASTAGLAASSLAILGWWIRRSLSRRAPLVDLRLAFRPGAVAANVTGVVAGVAVYMLIALVMVIVQAPTSSYGLGEPVTTAGLLLVPYSMATMAASRLSLTLARLMRPDLLLPLGSFVYLIATLLLAFRHGNVRELMIMMAVSGVGSGFTFAAMPSLIIRVVPLHETGSAMAFNHLLRFIGFAAGSTMSVVALDVFGRQGLAPSDAFRAAVLVAACIWVLVCVTSMVLPWHRPTAAQGDRISTIENIVSP